MPYELYLVEEGLANPVEGGLASLQKYSIKLSLLEASMRGIKIQASMISCVSCMLFAPGGGGLGESGGGGLGESGGGGLGEFGGGGFGDSAEVEHQA